MDDAYIVTHSALRNLLGECFAQIDHGAYMGSAFFEENCHEMFFDLCQQIGGPRLLPSKARGNRPISIEESNDKEGASAPHAFEDIDRIDGDALGKDGQVCTSERVDNDRDTYHARWRGGSRAAAHCHTFCVLQQS